MTKLKTIKYYGNRLVNIDEVIELIDEEKVYPDYQEFKQPAEAITQFKIRIKQKLKELKWVNQQIV